ncbi:ABC transporter ATP-binding protein [Leptospira ilyithenensis]|uniref:ABC transporter ATP-binding protein n=1 Tax=Leptospira ilyithenensis TaxID=2484901 RepID=UPI001FE78CA6|nr:ATP-binding cassette domain-containing protein [Leptospira ilyithenensis]
MDDISFSVPKAESLVILGRNGAGKTTLINLLFGYLWPTTGSVFVLNEEYGTTALKPIQTKIGIVQPSHQEQLLQKSLTVEEMILTGFYSTLGLYNDPTDEEKAKTTERLSLLNLTHKAKQTYSTLSSGEKSKVLLLRALGKGKEILILDEPAAALDVTARFELNGSISKIKKENPGLTRILITHRLEEIPKDFSSVLLLKEGKILNYGKKEDVLTAKHLSELYDLNLDVAVNNGQYSTSFK